MGFEFFQVLAFYGGAVAFAVVVIAAFVAVAFVAFIAGCGLMAVQAAFQMP